MKLKNHHLSKLENRGRAVNFEKRVGEIMEGLSDFLRNSPLQIKAASPSAIITNGRVSLKKPNQIHRKEHNHGN